MPSYDYACPYCGPFTALRPMAEFDQPHLCDCGTPSPRAILSAPAFFGMDAGQRRARDVNERSAHAPQRAQRHAASCGCCSGGRKLEATAVTAKSFPTQRPWMIGH